MMQRCGRTCSALAAGRASGPVLLLLLALFLPGCDTFQAVPLSGAGPLNGALRSFISQAPACSLARPGYGAQRIVLSAGKGGAGARGGAADQVPQHGKERLAELESLLGVKFNDESLLNQALVHRSAVYADKLKSNQRLEYLGDAILGMVVAEHLFESIPDADEGRLSEIRKRVINTRALAAAARAVGLGDWIHVADFESKRGGLAQEALLADAVEAIIAAVYLDRGIEVARKFVLSLLAEAVASAQSDNPEELDTKGKLRERIIKLALPPPEYHIVAAGPVHNPKFTAHVLVGGQRLGYGFGRTKKAAELAAACYSLEIVSEMPDTDLEAMRRMVIFSDETS